MIDLLDPLLHASGEADIALDELCATSPVARCAGRRGQGYWAVTGYPELVAISRDTETFSSWWGTRPEVRRAEGAPRPLHNLDGLEHAALRKLASRLVAPARLAVLSPRLADIARVQVERFARGDFREAMTGVVVPLVAHMVGAWLGVSAEASYAIAAHVEAVHAAGARLLDALEDPGHREAARGAATTLATTMRDALRSAPDGALAELRAIHTGDESDGDTASMLACLLVEAGLPTTIDALGNAIVYHAEKPPSDLDAAIDEVLRNASPIQQFARYATRDTEIAGVHIRRGDQVVLWFGAANRDPRRGNAPPVAFGAGPHRCLGAMFARDILRAALGAWFTRMPRYRARATRRASSYLWGYSSVLVLEESSH